MQYRRFLKKISIACLGLLILNGMFASQAFAGRYVLDQNPTTIQRYFGRPISVDGNIRTYSSVRLRRIFPDLPKDAKFQIEFDSNKTKRIMLGVNAPEGESFTYDPAKFFTYVFGYEPPIYKEIPLPWGGGGHEGFRDNKACLGDGVGTSYMTYRLGDDNISLYYDPACEPPYDQVPSN